ncbi:trypsin-like peptidase domain-containing protein [Cereibacter sphaeroides]|uniref:trypsin-like peptidase domain-containing protein n=1 Tax=Cereibacter sphaeroides TaxID=1063 RepID=UPI001F20718B|nr:trypsin-like peptidase domain-containing protein [Cereibacter sphaeroides]MCE6950436.1 trypsin-like peptidase domain-containing protein [Cereibacter sphaeroides]MCE6968196.1 trypsin-like peptidase domain-containing protein [Cereibacter sphaeroides]
MRLPVLFAVPILATLLPLAVPAETRVPASASEIALSFAPVVREAAPAVVNIYATRVVEQRVSPFAADPFFDRFFRDLGRRQPRVQNSLGSGVIVSADGIVVSNYHVVGQADAIRVVLNDRREYEAEVMLADEDSDLAVLRLSDAADLPFLPLRDSDGVEVGELVLAIGNPFGVGQTVSQGIVSGLARSGLSIDGGRGYFIQTDAAINPGNSGGALVDTAGRLLGINTAILTQSGGSNGIGFAIPANLVRSFLAQAEAGEERFRRPWAGVNGQAVDAAMADAMGLPRPEGVVLTELDAASPFRKAGLRAGDVVLMIGGQRTDSPQEVMFRLSAMGIGATARVTYLRDGDEREAEVALIAPPDDPPRETLTLRESVLAGLTVERINPAVSAELGLPLAAEGVVVRDAESFAARAGLRPGDLLLEINGRRVERPRDVLIASRDNARWWQVDILREGQPLRLRFRL